jgi:hypothetical protein
MDRSSYMGIKNSLSSTRIVDENRKLQMQEFVHMNKDYVTIKDKSTDTLTKALPNKITTIRTVIDYVKNKFITIQTTSKLKNNLQRIGENDPDFMYSDKWISINGKNNIIFEQNKLKDISTSLDSVSMELDLRIGLTKSNKFFVETSNPYVKFSSIEGAYLNKKVADTKRVKFTWGFQLGFGASYGLINKNMDVGPYGGFGIGLSF